MCCAFVGMILVVVLIITTSIVLLARFYQSGLIDNYIVRVEYTKYQHIADAVAQLKKNDLQEIFRELQIMDSLYTLIIDNDSLISSSYVGLFYPNSRIVRWCQSRQDDRQLDMFRNDRWQRILSRTKRWGTY